MSKLVHVPQAAIDLATRPEFDGLHGLRKDGLVYPYHDPVGLPTIGYGHLLSRTPWQPLTDFAPITIAEAKELLRQDLAVAARAVDRLITVQLNEHQRSALIDFVFNAGAGNLQASTLRRVINRSEFDEVSSQFMRWVYAKGVKLAGLVKRRSAEAALWATPV